MEVGSVWAGKSLSSLELRLSPSETSSTPGRTPPSPSSRHTSSAKVDIPDRQTNRQTDYFKQLLIGNTFFFSNTQVWDSVLAHATDIKQLWEKMDRVQDSVAANNASSQGRLFLWITSSTPIPGSLTCMCFPAYNASEKTGEGPLTMLCYSILNKL